MDKSIDYLGDARVFFIQDANWGYCQIKIDERDRETAAFISHHDLQRFQGMPFGQRNAPSTSQRAMDAILYSTKWQFAFVYLDDVVIFLKTSKEHNTHVRSVIPFPGDAGVPLNSLVLVFYKPNGLSPPGDSTRMTRRIRSHNEGYQGPRNPYESH